MSRQPLFIFEWFCCQPQPVEAVNGTNRPTDKEERKALAKEGAEMLLAILQGINSNRNFELHTLGDEELAARLPKGVRVHPVSQETPTTKNVRAVAELCDFSISSHQNWMAPC